MATEEERRSPFATALERVASVPVNAAKLPFTLLREAIDPAAARRLEAPESAQRALYEQATGQPAPFSEGRQWANRLSLGLIPDNQPATVDPAQLDPAQAQRFGQMTPLMQALLQSKRPQDFADLLTNEALFAEPDPTAGLKSVPRTDRLFDTSTGEIVLEAEQADQVVAPGSAVVRDGEPVFTNEFVDSSLQGQRDAAADASRATAELRRGEAGLLPAKGEKLAAETDKARALAEKADREATGGPSLGDRNKIGGMEKRANDAVGARVKDLDRGFTAARNAQQLFELRDSASLPATYRRELVDMGFEDIDSRDPRSVQDLMFMTMGVRAADPPGRITDKDVDMYSRARAYFDPGIVEAVRKGQVLTNAQRNEMMVAIKKLTTGLLTTNDQAVVDGRKTALRDLVAGQGVGMNPANIQDRGADLRQAYFGQEFGDQAAYPVADREAEQLLEQLWDIKNPGKVPTASELVRFANEHGFRIQEFEQ